MRVGNQPESRFDLKNVPYPDYRYSPTKSIMPKNSFSRLALAISSMFMPFAVFAQDSDSGSSVGKMENVIFAILPFLILAVLFWFFFIRQVKKQQSSPLVLRHQAHMDAQEQHMKRMEQLLERIAMALEKDRNQGHP